jgi:hypothetical protein
MSKIVCTICASNNPHKVITIEINGRDRYICACCVNKIMTVVSPPENQEMDEFVSHLIGLTEVVINESYGDFELSPIAQRMYLDRAKIPYTIQHRSDRFSDEQFGPYLILSNGVTWDCKRLERDDPNLIDIVKELGIKAEGNHASLKIVKVPSNVEWTIHQHNGFEWVAEKHRTWF